MNNTFSIQRFGLLLKRQWLEFGKIYLISLLVALGIIIAFYGFAVLPIKPYFSVRQLSFREPLFLIFGFIFISIIASSYFAHLGQKPKAIIELMIPASTFEKFLSGIFFTAILSIASFTLLFYLTDLVFVAKLRSTFPNLILPGADVRDQLTYFFEKNNTASIFKAVYVIPFFVTSIFLLGSIYFNKFHYIKTAISVMIFSGIWTYVTIKSSEFLMSNRVPIDNGNFNEGKNVIELWGTLLLVVLTVIFWTITYVRLKEKEV